MKEKFQQMLSTAREPIHLAQYHKCGQCASVSRRACLLHEAISCNRHDVVQAIVSHKPCANSSYHNGRTALIEASWRGNSDLVKILLDHGANINLCDDFGNSPLLIASGTQNLEVFDLLLNRGADIYSCNNSETNILHHIASFGRIEMMNILNNRDSRFFRQYVNQADIYGSIPLHRAAMFGQTDMATLMMICGANTNYKDASGCTPLHTACLWGKPEVITLFCHYESTEISPQSNGGFTPWELFENQFPSHSCLQIIKDLLSPKPIYIPDHLLSNDFVLNQN